MNNQEINDALGSLDAHGPQVTALKALVEQERAIAYSFTLLPQTDAEMRAYYAGATAISDRILERVAEVYRKPGKS